MTHPTNHNESPSNTEPPVNTPAAPTTNPPDLLPDDYRRAIRERGTLMRRIALMALSIIITIPFIYRAQDQRTTLHQQIDQLNIELAADQLLADQLPALQADYDTLVLHAALIEKHNPPIDYSNIAAAISQTLTPADSIRQLTLNTITPTEPTPAVPTPNDNEENENEQPADPPITLRPHIQLTLITLSPTEQQASALINRLTALSILTNTTATGPTPVTYNNLVAHTVTLTAYIPLDRNYTPPPDPPAQSNATPTQEQTRANP